MKANFNLQKADMESVTDVLGSGLIAVGLSETWLNENLHDSLFKIDNYILFRLDRKLVKGGRGWYWGVIGGVIFYYYKDAQT